MYILFNESGSGFESMFGPDLNSSYESYVIGRNTTYDNYDNESKVSVKLIHILILITICFVCVIIPFFYVDMMHFCFDIKSKFRTIHLCKCKKIKTKIEPIFDDCHSKDIDTDTDTNKDICTICLSVNNQKSMTLRCGHKFHETCIREWAYVSYEKSYNAYCPLCRNNIFV